ncbi:hypothetical protein VitviT2T_005366 [Vitis vinifera]|uniref:Reverse transcriptase Ty1/copia-type domain-containing protein n=2 Tax=Vitis vinifera TaxID=29760 RepID=A0ABY9BT17_VITVI|nr:hypothetical protein VitviT2T_005366 [Vitis vinifera]
MWSRVNPSTKVSEVAQERSSVTKPPSLVFFFFFSHGHQAIKIDRCQYLHSWFKGHGVFKLAELNGHIKAISGIVLPSGSEKLYTASGDGYIRVWDCHTGHCDGAVNLGGEIGSLISAGPWVFAGIKNVVKAWNIEYCADLSLDGPVGQIYAMVVDHDMLFAGAENGTIYAWKPNKETNAFELATTLGGHNCAVVSLTVGGGKLYSGSMDNTIRVWDLNTLQCIHTLKEHASVVMSLGCWGPYLISCSLDQTIKVWFATEAGNLEVTYTHNEEHGVLALFGMFNSEGKPILLCSCNDNSVRLYELPSTTKEDWDKLKLDYQRSDRTKQMQVLNLKRDFKSLTMQEDETITKYSDRIALIVNKIRSLGEEFPDARIVEKVLVTLLERFESKISSLEESRDLSQISLVEMMNALQAQEQKRALRQENVTEDVKSAFLNGFVDEEIHVEQPDGVVAPGKEDYVYLLRKALYGLKQAPRAWYETMDKYLTKLGFVRSQSEATLYVKTDDVQLLIVSLYVDDMLVTGNQPRLIQSFKDEMNKVFEMTDLGVMKYFWEWK